MAAKVQQLIFTGTGEFLEQRGLPHHYLSVVPACPWSLTAARGQFLLGFLLTGLPVSGNLVSVDPPDPLPKEKLQRWWTEYYIEVSIFKSAWVTTDRYRTDRQTDRTPSPGGCSQPVLLHGSSDLQAHHAQMTAQQAKMKGRLGSICILFPTKFKWWEE